MQDDSLHSRSKLHIKAIGIFLFSFFYNLRNQLILLLSIIDTISIPRDNASQYLNLHVSSMFCFLVGIR